MEKIICYGRLSQCHSFLSLYLTLFALFAAHGQALGCEHIIRNGDDEGNERARVFHPVGHINHGIRTGLAGLQANFFIHDIVTLTGLGADMDIANFDI